MDYGTRVVLSLALLLAFNNAVVRLPMLKDRELLFWAVQFLDIGVGSALLWWGIPGFEGTPAVSWMMGLLLFLHVAQNMRWRARRRAGRGQSTETEERASAIRAALEKSERDAQ